MFKLKPRSHQADSFFVMLLFFLFALTAFILVLIGVKQYKSTANAMNYNYEVRTVTSYLREKVRQNDSDAAISVETINDIVYNTFIYYYGGSLRELYVQDGSSYSLDSGQRIVEIGGLDMTETTDKMITVTITDTSGGTTDTYCSVNSD